MEYHRIRFGKLGDHPTVDFALQELTRYLKQMDPQLMVEVLQKKALDPGLSGIIWVGLDETLEDKVLPVAEKELDDAIRISVTEGSGYITGSNYRSVLIAAYRFLQALGCRWVRPGKEGERIPPREIENVSVKITEKASYRHRGVCIEGANSYENVADMIDYLPKVGMNEYFIQFMVPMAFFDRWYVPQRNPYLQPMPISRGEVAAMTVALESEISRRSLRYHKTGHGWTCEPFGIDGTGWDTVENTDLPPEILECTALVNGKRGIWKDKPLLTSLCFSNPVARNKMTDAVVSYCKENRNVDVLHFWLADEVNNQCECAACAERSPADWYITLLNELDEKMTAQQLTTKVVFLIYLDLLWPPETEKLINKDRFILMFAPITRKYGISYTDALACPATTTAYVRNRLEMPKELADNLAYLRLWQDQFSGDSFVFDYHLMWAHASDPGYERCAKNLFEDMKSLRKLGLNGMVSCQVQRCSFPTGLPMHMMARALWDETCDYEKEVRDYYRAAYGKDAEAVHNYLSQVSGNISVYESVACGHPVYDKTPLCQDYAAVEAAVAKIREVIGEKPAGDFRTLQLHTEFVLYFLDCLKQLEGGDLPGRTEAWKKLGEFINRNELVLQKQLDGFITHRILQLRLGLGEQPIDFT